MVQSAHVGCIRRPRDGSDWRSHVGALRVESPADSFRRRHQRILHLKNSRSFLTGADEREDFPAEDSADGPEDDEVEKYPRVSQDVERILQEVSDVHGWVWAGLGASIWNMQGV